jgi:cortactin
MDQFRAEIQKEDAEHIKRKLSEDGYNLSRGYGGKFGVEKDRMDKSAMGHDYQVQIIFICHKTESV